MLKRCILFPVLLCSLLSAHSQKDEAVPDILIPYYRLLHQMEKGTDSAMIVDSSVYYAGKIAETMGLKILVRDFIHNQFLQNFAPKNYDASNTTSRIYRSVLQQMATGANKPLAGLTQPFLSWMLVRENIHDEKETDRLITSFITDYLGRRDIYENKSGLYGILIYHLTVGKHAKAEELLQIIYDKLNASQIKVDPQVLPLQQRRTWHRYLFAYCNVLYGNRLLKNGKAEEAGNYFKLAFDYSPDLADRNVQSAFFYDMMMIFDEEKRSFRDEYLDFLATQNKNDDLLAALLSTALIDPTYKKKLKSHYQKNFPDREPFNDYWIKNINAGMSPVKEFVLQKIDGSSFSVKANKGKWMLIDFWGTWCGPCRAEHPDLEKFHKQIRKRSDILLLTVACRDKEEKVTAYMRQYKYSFPVAMADKEIENLYRIDSYPSKVLITPQGKYMIIPFGVNCVEFIKAYVGL